MTSSYYTEENQRDLAEPADFCRRPLASTGFCWHLLTSVASVALVTLVASEASVASISYDIVKYTVLVHVWG